MAYYISEYPKDHKYLVQMYKGVNVYLTDDVSKAMKFDKHEAECIAEDYGMWAIPEDELEVEEC